MPGELLYTEFRFGIAPTSALLDVKKMLSTTPLLLPASPNPTLSRIETVSNISDAVNLKCYISLSCMLHDPSTYQFVTKLLLLLRLGL